MALLGPPAGALMPLRRLKVFHAAQCGHCPCHFSASPPHELQINTGWLRAMAEPMLGQAVAARTACKAALSRHSANSSTMPRYAQPGRLDSLHL